MTIWNHTELRGRQELISYLMFMKDLPSGHPFDPQLNFDKENSYQSPRRK